MNDFNRPSVILFNTDNIERSSVIVENPNYFENDRNRESVIVSNENIINNNSQINQNIFDELSNDSFENYFENNIENNENIVSRSELSQQEYLNIIRNNYEMLNETNQYSRLYGLMFSHIKTKINPDIYEELRPDNFLDLFRDIFQDIFNRVIEKIETEFPNKFSKVKVNIKGDNININLAFTDITNVTSDLFLIELYRLLQSKRDIITSAELELSFTFLPKKQ